MTALVLPLKRVEIPEVGTNDVKIPKIHKNCYFAVQTYIFIRWNEMGLKAYHRCWSTAGHGICWWNRRSWSWRYRAFKVSDIVSGEGHITCGKCRNFSGRPQRNCKETQKALGVKPRNGCFAEYSRYSSLANVWSTKPNIPEEMYAHFGSIRNATHTALSHLRHSSVKRSDPLVLGPPLSWQQLSLNLQVQDTL